MAGEMVMGLHSKMTYKGERLAGMYPHRQAEIAARAGVDIFGVAVNSDTSMSTPYNLSRTVTFTKAAALHTSIPIHANSGMGVGGDAHDTAAVGGLLHQMRKGAGGDWKSRWPVGWHR